MIRRNALVALLLALGAANAAAEELSGQVRLLERGRAGDDAVLAVVSYVPDGGAVQRALPVTVEITTRNRRFQPRLLAVPVGSTVRFPNEDAVRHNVFSVSPGNQFDLGLYGPGSGRSRRLDQAGLVRLFCNVHRDMAAFVLVLDTPFFATTDAAGRFALTGLPSGSGTLQVWHPRAEPVRRPLTVPSAEPLVVTIDVTLPPVPIHLNKRGQPYRDDAGDDGYR